LRRLTAVIVRKSVPGAVWPSDRSASRLLQAAKCLRMSCAALVNGVVERGVAAACALVISSAMARVFE
jgi:hypothetical protein